MRVAVLDLGTNVFNLLLAEFSPQQCNYLKEYKCAARLGAGGLSKGIISPEAFETATVALGKIMEAIRESGGADLILPFATSAVRDAQNGPEFVKYVDARFGISVQVIPGEREAELIFKGISGSLQGKVKPGERVLMLDIGGGSNEFIISEGETLLWKQSFPIGMARMREMFNYREPISAEVIREFREYCTEAVMPLWKEVERYKPSVFVGSSGSFDTFKDLIYNCKYKDLPSIEIPFAELERISRVLMASLPQERLAMPGMSPVRVDFIVLAAVFTGMILERVQPHVIYQSSYSLKEGAMQEEYLKYLIENNKK